MSNKIEDILIDEGFKLVNVKRISIDTSISGVCYAKLSELNNLLREIGMPDKIALILESEKNRYRAMIYIKN